MDASKLAKISADSHVDEPHGLWFERRPENLCEQAPRRIQASEDGGRNLVVDGNPIGWVDMTAEEAQAKEAARGVDDGWATVSAPLAAEHGMGEGASDTNPDARYILALLDAVVPWLAVTPARDGSPLLDDPRVRDVLVEMELDFHIAEASPGPMGPVVSAESLIRQSTALLDLVGPVGLVARGSTGAWHGGLGEQTFRFAPGTSIYGGSTKIHRNLIAETVLGLARNTPRGS